MRLGSRRPRELSGSRKSPSKPIRPVDPTPIRAFLAAPKLMSFRRPPCQARITTFRRSRNVRDATRCRRSHSGPGPPASISCAGPAARCGVFGNAAGCVAYRTTPSSGAFRTNRRPSKCTTTISSRNMSRCERSSPRSDASLNASSTIPPAPQNMMPTGSGSWPFWNGSISTSNDSTRDLRGNLRAPD